MKKKNLKSLTLKKSTISSFEIQEIKGGTSTEPCKVTFTIGIIIASYAVCPDDRVTDNGCVSNGGEYSCDCTVA
ncbi:hypothetical protein C8N46_107242 [Kordia periserrulae]|uniref:Uncharacterized protein n=1 Tax=Kordia periserrulae TaxID=701523 RepID=A0A2T6BVZ0_9FLAO|nr:hypothetical protein [Kordia periserrulae]PTX60235.1 hypothetical protein C8N46_107242 [Kordia periserrulae]